MNQLKCDILIIGSGAAGGVLAATLAERTQQDILLIEKGGFFTKESFNQRELDMGMLYAGGGSRSTSDGAIPVRGGECVGGGTTVNLALCFDPIPAVWDRWRESSGLQGFSFDDAASDYGQTGLNMRGCLAEVRQRLNVHAVAPEQINDNNRLLERGCRQLGIATKRFELNMRDCRQCGYCAQGCAYDHKQGTMVTYIADALNRGVRLLHHCDVDKIRFQRRGEKQVATGAVGMIHPTRPGSQANLVPPGLVEIAARLVIVAAGARDALLVTKVRASRPARSNRTRTRAASQSARHRCLRPPADQLSRHHRLRLQRSLFLDPGILLRVLVRASCLRCFDHARIWPRPF
ncbi:MAG: FAD-dependent oxidoreductase [Planctomycetota bacterium]|nr:FAD-dependent oxidoreductase [Planctomycetota bacterium]